MSKISTVLKAFIVLVIVVGALVIFVAVRPKPNVTASAIPLTSVTGNGVQVDLTLEQSGQNQGVLAARYTPLQDHFHVYSKDLPLDGVDGLGRPTRLAVISGLDALGDVSADMPTISLKTDGLPEILPVYPDGPVVLRLPIKWVGNASGIVKVSYMACSTTGCLPPTEKTLEISLPLIK